MKKNIAVSTFLKQRREELSKTLKNGGEAMGCFSSQYHRWESEGHLPIDLDRQKKMAEFLEISHDHLLSKISVRVEKNRNLIHLIKAIAQTNCEAMSLEDIQFLSNVQSGLDHHMSSELIQELMKHRIKTDSEVKPSSNSH